MNDADDRWFDDAAGPLVRPYAMTRGRTRPANDLELVTQVVAVRPEGDPTTLTHEHQAIIELCQRPLSVAEVAAYINAPVFVAKVLLSDLIDRGDIVANPATPTMSAVDRELLQAVLDGIRAL